MPRVLLGLLALLVSCSDSSGTGPSNSDVAITTQALPDGGVAVPYAATLAATGGTGSHAWSVETGALPAGLSLSVNGAITGTPTTAGTSSFTVRATSGGESATRAYAINILPPAVSIGTSSVAAGEVGAPYSQTLTATGGNGSYAWSVLTGSLPAGLNLSGLGTISGMPTAAGTSSFTVQVSSGGRVATRELSITIGVQQLSVTTTALDDAVVGAPYSATLGAAGGSGNYAWSISAGELPIGLALGPAGNITGTPTVGGTSSFTVRVASGTLQATRALSITVQSPSVSITTTSLSDAVARQAYSQALTAAGGNGTYSWSLTGGALPSGLTLSSGGLISGTPDAAGTSTFTVRVTSGGQSASLAFTLTVLLPPVTVSTTTLPGGTIGVAYSQQLSATGGTGSFTWSIAAGSLPAGLSLAPGGLLSGTPTAAGTTTFTVRATSAGASATRDLSITVLHPAVVIGTSSLPNASAGQPYTQSLSATGGDGIYDWSLFSGSLPAGLTLSAAGTITGTPTAPGTSAFVVRATSGGQADTAPLSITVDPVVADVAITTTSLPPGTVGAPYTQALAATGGTGSYAWAITTGSLPAGLTLSPSGVISGTPTAAGGPHTFTVQVTIGTQTASGSLAITIDYPPVQVTTSSLPDGAVSSAYSQNLIATGGDGSFSWSLAAGSGPLPPGLTLSTGGVISGTPTTAGTSTFTVQATSAGLSATRPLTINVVAVVPPVAITTTSLPGATVGQAYSQMLQATGGDGTYGWTVSVGSLPAGLTLDAAGLLSGTPSAAGTSTFTVQATSGTGSDTQDLSITVGLAPVVITTTTLPGGQVGVTYSHVLTATGGNGSYTWSVLSGIVPAGLTLYADGTISGTPAAAGSSTFSVQAASGGLTGSGSLTIDIAAPQQPVSITTTSLPAATTGQAYSQTLAATGGDGSYAWSVSAGSLPAGLTLSQAGVLSGTATTPGTSSFTVQAVSGGSSDTQDLSLTVLAPPPAVTTSTLPDGEVSVAYSQQLGASGGDGTYSWSLQSGTLPAGLTLATDGAISGTPSVAGTSTFTVLVTSAGQTAAGSLSITVIEAGADALVITTTSPLPEGQRFLPYTTQLSATGGTGSYSWSLSSGSLPPGVTLSPAGVISGTPGSPGNYAFTVQVTSGAQTATAPLSLRIRP